MKALQPVSQGLAYEEYLCTGLSVVLLVGGGGDDAGGLVHSLVEGVFNIGIADIFFVQRTLAL